MSGRLITRPGRRYRFRQTEIWAERGLVHVFDFRANPYQPEYVKRSVASALKSAQAIGEMARKCPWPDEREELVSWVETMIRVCREAQAQGSPHDERTLEHVRNMRNKWYLPPGQDIRAAGGR